MGLVFYFAALFVVNDNVTKGVASRDHTVM